MNRSSAAYVQVVRNGTMDWLESVRYPDEGWGRWKYNARMTRPYGLIPSRIAIQVLHDFNALDGVADKQKQEAITFFQSTQDPQDGYFKDPLVTETDRIENATHSWEDIWGQMNAEEGLCLLGAKPLHRMPMASFADLRQVNVREWVLSLNWKNPWHVGERFYRCINAYIQTLHEVPDSENDPILREAFETLEEHVMDPVSGTPSKHGCSNPTAMAGLFKLILAYQVANRPVPHAQRGIDFTLTLQHDDGEFEWRGNMCINWDALWILRELDDQLAAGYRHQEIVCAGNMLAQYLMVNYRKDDGGFAFCGAHCVPVHHSIRISDSFPISDMLGTFMCLKCLAYVDEWNGESSP